MTAVATKSVEELALNRRSIRKYESTPVPQNDVRRILEIARSAPTAFNTQPTRFVVVQNPELKTQLQAAAFGQPQVGSAPVVIVIVSDMENVLETAGETAHPALGAEGIEKQVGTFQNSFGSQTVESRGTWGNALSNIVFGYLLLAVESMGYVSSPMLGFNPQAVKELLGLPAHVTITGLLAFGKAAEEGRPQHRHSVDRITTWK
jgi:nitroreductase